MLTRGLMQESNVRMFVNEYHRVACACVSRDVRAPCVYLWVLEAFRDLP